MRLLLLIHMLLVVLASTSFTALTFFRDGSWSVEFYKLVLHMPCPIGYDDCCVASTYRR